MCQYHTKMRSVLPAAAADSGKPLLNRHKPRSVVCMCARVCARACVCARTELIKKSISLRSTIWGMEGDRSTDLSDSKTLIWGRFNAYEILITPSIKKNKTTGSLNARKLFWFKKGQKIRGWTCYVGIVISALRCHLLVVTVTEVTCAHCYCELDVEDAHC